MSLIGGWLMKELVELAALAPFLHFINSIKILQISLPLVAWRTAAPINWFMNQLKSRQWASTKAISKRPSLSSSINKLIVEGELISLLIGWWAGGVHSLIHHSLKMNGMAPFSRYFRSSPSRPPLIKKLKFFNFGALPCFTALITVLL